MKIFWFDTETTGLDPKENDILTLACIVEIDGEVKEELTFNMRPMNPASISQKALDVNGLNKMEILKWPHPREAKAQIAAVMGKYVDKYDKEDKFVVGGQNVNFDRQFLHEMFVKQGDKYLGSFLSYHLLDTVSMAAWLKYMGMLDVPNFKLVTLTSHFKIDHKAHDALEDIRACRRVALAMMDRVRGKK